MDDRIKVDVELFKNFMIVTYRRVGDSHRKTIVIDISEFNGDEVTTLCKNIDHAYTIKDITEKELHDYLKPFVKYIAKQWIIQD